MMKITHGNPPRTGGVAAFLGRADLILAIPLRLAHPQPGVHDIEVAESRNAGQMIISERRGTLGRAATVKER